MELINRIKHQLHDRMIEKRLSKTTQRSSIDFDKVKNVGILFNGTALDERQQVEAFQKKWEKMDKTVRLFCFYDSKEPQPNLALDHFTKQEVNWVGKINSEKAEAFIHQQFDLLICCNDEQVLNDIAAMSKSKLRVGPIIEKEYCYDLMIAKDQKKNTKHYLEQVEQFLNKLKQGNHASKNV